MSCTWGPYDTIRLWGSSRPCGKSILSPKSVQQQGASSSVGDTSSVLGDCVYRYTGVRWGKCVTTKRLRKAVMIPPGLKHTHLTFKFNVSMLRKSHRGGRGDFQKNNFKPNVQMSSHILISCLSQWLTVNLSEHITSTSTYRWPFHLVTTQCSLIIFKFMTVYCIFLFANLHQCQEKGIFP